MRESGSRGDPPPLSLGSNLGRGDVVGVEMSMVGVSGTLFRVIPGVLNPGETLRVPVWVRGLGGGKQTLR